MLEEGDGNPKRGELNTLPSVPTRTGTARPHCVLSHLRHLTRRRMQWILLWTLLASIIFILIEAFNLFGTDSHYRDTYPDDSGDSCVSDIHSDNMTGWQARWASDSLCGLSLSPGERKIVSPGGQANYLAFRLPPPLLATRPPFALKPTTSLPAYCIDSHLSKGTPCPCIPRDSESPIKLDVVWSWVNGSDPFHIRSLRATQKLLSYTPDPKLFRDHDELRYSFRSVLAHFRESVAQFRLLVSDVESPGARVPQRSRLGQIPQWLSDPSVDPESNTAHGAEMWQDGNIQLDIRHHSAFFQPDLLSGPTFNSFAIESQLGTICNTTENFVYMNDDFFMTSDLVVDDFYNPEFGLVIKYEYNEIIWPRDPSWMPPEGEWRPLERSAALLAQRFGYRGRPYITHAPKIMSVPLMHELSLGMWRKDFAETARRPLRGMNGRYGGRGPHGGRHTLGGDDVHASFLFGNYVVERWREALLWIWVVARIGASSGSRGSSGTADDIWDQHIHGKRAWAELGGAYGSYRISVSAGRRDTLDRRRVEQILGQKASERMKTSYTFCSMDGYPLAFIFPEHSKLHPRYSRPPPLTPYPHDASAATGSWRDPLRNYLTSCIITYHKCFPSELRRASDVFVHIAFADIACGDCIIRALVSSSGPLGLSGFLPPASLKIPFDSNSDERRASTSNPSPPPPPHLPLDADYRQANFTLEAVTGPWASRPNLSLREWTLQLLQRYRFVIGDAPYEFRGITNPGTAVQAVRTIDRHPLLAFACLNDDVGKGESYVDYILQRWMRHRWPTAAAWERKGK